MKFYEWLNTFFSDSKKVLYFSLIVGSFFVLLHLIFCIDIYDDVAGSYAWTAREIGRGNWDGGFMAGLPPLMTYTAGLLCACGFEAFTATIFISGLFYVLTALPLYFLIKDLLGERFAGWGALTYILAPKVIRLGCSGMLNSGRNFFLIWSLIAILSFFKDRSWKKIVVIGIALAGLTLIRGEGIIFIPFFALIFIVMYFFKKEKPITAGFIGGMLLRGVVIITVILAAVSPRLIQMYNRTGYAVLDSRQAGRWNEFVSRFKSAPSSPAQKTEIKANIKQESFIHRYFNFKYIKKFINTFIRGSYELYFIFAIIGIILIVRRKEWKPEYYALLGLCAANTLVFYFVTVSYRYFTINILLFLPFTLKGFELVWDILNHKYLEPYKVKYLFPAAVAVIGLAQSWNGLAKLTDYEDFYYEKAVADWVSQEGHKNGKDKLTIMSIHPQYPFWADANHIMLVDNDNTNWIEKLNNTNYDYIILENKYEDKIKEIKKHKDIVEIPQNWKDEVTIFQKKH